MPAETSGCYYRTLATLQETTRTTCYSRTSKRALHVHIFVFSFEFYSIFYFYSILRPPQEPNLLILHDAPHARIHKHYINQGVVRADPYSYSRQYGSDINIARYSHIVDEATHAVPPPITEIRDHHDRYDNYASYWGDYQRSPSYISSRWESPRREYSIPRSSSYHYYDYSGYDAPYRHYYDDYYSYPRRGSYVTMEDVTSSWGRYCGSSSYDSYPSSYFSRSSYYDSYPSSYRSYSSSYPLETIHVNSENEFHDVLSRLTNGRIPSTDYPY